MLYFAAGVSRKGITAARVNPMMGTDAAGLRELGATSMRDVRESDEWWRVITAGFLHAGFVDLVFGALGVTQRWKSRES